MCGIAGRCPSAVTSLVIALTLFTVAHVCNGSSSTDDIQQRVAADTNDQLQSAIEGSSLSGFEKRAPSFRLGKRPLSSDLYDSLAFDDESRPDVVRRAPSFRLGKRQSPEVYYYYRRAPSFRLGKRSGGYGSADDGLLEVKRAPTFRLGKRTFYDSEDDDEQTTFEKRAPAFRLG